jgi:hypothetical protein
MKTITIILLVAVVAIAAFLVFRHASSVVRAPSTAVRVAHSPALPPSKILALNQVKMVTVRRSPKNALSSRVTDPWLDVRLIVNSGANIRDRFAAIDRLPSRISDADWALLRNFLLKSDSLDAEQLGQVLKNVLMNKLCGMTPTPPGLDAVFVQMGKDFKQNQVMRDYALQHLATFDENLAGQNGKAIAKEEKADQNALWNALFETSDSMAGTALYGLERLAKAGEQVDSNRLSGMALEMASDPNAGELTLSSAYQVCAKRDVQQALPVIEAAAQSSETISLQISAIGALGVMGGANDLSLLQNLLQGNEERLKLPARTAINQIQQRLQLQVSVR